jgi:hypothetical protein
METVKESAPQSKIEFTELVVAGISKDGKFHWRARGVDPINALKYVDLLKAYLLREVMGHDNQNQKRVEKPSNGKVNKTKKLR